MVGADANLETSRGSHNESNDKVYPSIQNRSRDQRECQGLVLYKAFPHTS